ncbi:MAG TPA: hypothetical protein EYP85_14220 [Armatimonadetes bacterium]|nr:hypothetical protein [Armatimonadota bacterium]
MDWDQAYSRAQQFKWVGLGVLVVGILIWIWTKYVRPGTPDLPWVIVGGALFTSGIVLGTGGYCLEFVAALARECPLLRPQAEEPAAEEEGAAESAEEGT